MPKKQPVNLALISVLADVCINFSVFWFGLAIASPIFPGIDPTFKLTILTVDISLGILSMSIGYRLRKVIYEFSGT